MRITLFDEEYGAIDQKIATVPSREVPRLLRNIPLDAFGHLLLDVPPEFPNLKAFFPSMPPDAVQDTWTGNQGITPAPAVDSVREDARLRLRGDHGARHRGRHGARLWLRVGTPDPPALQIRRA